VIVTATIAVPASSTSTQVQATLSAALPNATAATTALSITVESAPIIVVAALLPSLPPPSPSPPPPSPPPSQPTTAFGFSSATSLGWSNGGGDPPYAFTLRTGGGTPSSGTGPSSGVDGTGSYFYAEASSPRSEGDLFTLAYDGSACSDIGQGVSTVAFHYHMYGADMGELHVTNAAGEAVWSLSGDQGDAWHAVSVGVFSASFAFEYKRGGGYRGDAAVAQVAVSCGAAPPPPPPSPPSPPSPPPPPPSPPLHPGSQYAYSSSDLKAALGDSAVSSIVLKAGTYEFDNDMCSNEGGSALCIDRDVTIEAEVAGTVVLNAKGARRVIYVSNTGRAELAGLNITGGETDHVCSHLELSSSAPMDGA
jgi:hypothetical protein